jgi:hypothetical protein
VTTSGDSGSGDSSDRKVRITLDLAREQHRFLRRFAFEAEADATAVLRALVSLLEEDATVAKKALARTERRYAR